MNEKTCDLYYKAECERLRCIEKAIKSIRQFQYGLVLVKQKSSIDNINKLPPIFIQEKRFFPYNEYSIKELKNWYGFDY